MHLGLHRLFLAARAGGSAARSRPALLLGGVLLWEVALRSQMGVAISFLEEIWSRNLGPCVRQPAAAVGAGRGPDRHVGDPHADRRRCRRSCSPGLLYAFNLFSLGPIIVLFFANLMIMGWWVALGVVSLILRHGAGAEALAWSVLFGLTPFSAVFYPVSVLPAALQPIALALPSAHVFEGMRAAMLARRDPPGTTWPGRSG